jgi:two-component system sensor histidine kinase KdpD
MPALLDEEDHREMLEVINEECDRLNRFIEGLVEMARIEAGEFRLRRRWGTVEEMIETALARTKNLMSQQRVQIDIENELPVILVDAGAISEVFYTLIDNAAKYSPPETIIRVSAARAENDMITASVEDRGPGIPVELRERVFDKFFRAFEGNNPRSQPSGTGMGLAIARGIIEVHNGHIWIESGQGGSGTRVVFTLPIGDQYDAETNAESIEERSIQ